MWTNPGAVRPSTSSLLWLRVITAASAANSLLPWQSSWNYWLKKNIKNWDKMETVIILKLFWTETWLEWSEEKTQRVLEESLTCYISRSTVIVINKQEKPTQFIFKMFRNTTGKYNTVQVYPKQFLRLSCKHGLRWSLVVHIWILTQRNWIKSDRKVDQIIIKTLLGWT